MERRGESRDEKDDRSERRVKRGVRREEKRERILRIISKPLFALESLNKRCESHGFAFALSVSRAKPGLHALRTGGLGGLGKHQSPKIGIT